jgi:hypothetical protein
MTAVIEDALRARLAPRQAADAPDPVLIDWIAARVSIAIESLSAQTAVGCRTSTGRPVRAAS